VFTALCVWFLPFRFSYDTHTWSNVWLPTSRDGSSRSSSASYRHGPSPRNAAAACALPSDDADYFYMHGGDDGGYSRHSPSYVINILGDVWRFSTVTLTWTLLTHGNLLQRAHHTSFLDATGESLYIFGGLEPTGISTRDSNDMWRFVLAKEEWKRVQCSGSAGLPTRRYGHASAISRGSPEIVYMFGGFALGRGNLHDLWQFNLEEHTWVILAPTLSTSSSSQQVQPSVEQLPSVRGYSQMVCLGDHLYLYGGAECNPGCSCRQGVWIFDIVTQKWALQPPVDASFAQPVHRYKHSMVSDGRALYVFGGESYKPSGYYNDVWKYAVSESTQSPSILANALRWKSAAAFYPIFLLFITGIIVVLYCLNRHRSRNRRFELKQF
jgi:Galactose oxidase, central domain/Kelch motif